MTSDGPTLLPGDVLKVERRQLVDGKLARSSDQGTFAGVQTVGTAEHLVLEGGRKKGVRLVPLHTISEIRLVKAIPRDAKIPAAPSWDPGVV
jgi:hypothetical protein